MFKSIHTGVGWARVFGIAAVIVASADRRSVDAQQGTAALPSGTWELTEAMSTGRVGHAAAGLRDGRVLVAGGTSGSWDNEVASAEVYDPAQRTWSITRPMSTARTRTAATLLPDGRVLVAGGLSYREGRTFASAETYDPVGGTWSLASPMSTARYDHTATLLSNDRVVVVGGYNAELYDPALGRWSDAGTLMQPRWRHTATRLLDGRVLVTGGEYADDWGSPISLWTSETYDPAGGTWSYAGDMTMPRYQHTATLLRDGRVLVAGGWVAATETYYEIADAEIYDPALGTWQGIAPMGAARYGHTATLLPDGRVLVAGGSSSFGALAAAEVYDPALGIWSRASSMSTVRAGHSATLLAAGNVLVAGGAAQTSAELYNPDATPAPDASAPLVTCAAADGLWYKGGVGIACTATDPESGLANEWAATFWLSASVPVGTESDNAATGSLQVCNTHGGCTMAGPIGGNRVDNKPPTITITSPAAGAIYQENARVSASYGCADGGAGVATCVANAAIGGLIDTSATGSKTFGVAAIDGVENYSQSKTTYTVVSSGADVGIALSAPTKVGSGATLTYVMSATNAGAGGATGVVVSNTLPAGTVFESAATSQGTVTVPARGSNGVVSAALGVIGLGATATVSVVVRVTAAAGTALTDTATVTATTADSNSSNNSSTRKTSVTGQKQ